ncbi:hypothetical protein ANO14919_144420 [Xylariales sp. No.14919]|nr:hypothetical protein ANO14919_144420 [Xylariales sp. No.14919]
MFRCKTRDYGLGSWEVDDGIVTEDWRPGRMRSLTRMADANASGRWQMRKVGWREADIEIHLNASPKARDGDDA